MLSENLSPNTLRPIFSNALTLKLETIKLDAFIQSFSKGQTLSGKVVQVLPGQKAVMEIQGEKLLLQFPRPVTQGQNITIKIEQIHPNLVLKLTEPASPAVGSRQEAGTAKPQNSDKTSIQSRVTDSLPPAPAGNKNPGPSAPARETAPSLLASQNKSVSDPVSQADLKRLGIEVGQKVKAEVLRVVDRETLQVRFKGNEITVRNTSSQKFQPSEPVHINTRPHAPGKFILEVEPVPPAAHRAPLGLSLLKNYLPTRQPFIQVLSGLKEVFLDGTSNPLKGLNIDPGQLEQLRANLQKIVSRDFKAPDAPRLKEIVDRSGFHYEAKVKDFVAEPAPSHKNALLESDLKGQLMRLARQLEQMPAPATESAPSDKLIVKLMAQVNQAVSNIELQQLTHHFSREEQHPVLLQLPENLLGEEDRFKIYILPDKGDGSGQDSDPENRVFNLVFLLNLSALGDLRIETRVYKNEISILITGSDSAVIQFIQAHVPELEDSLKEEGFSLSVTSRHQTDVEMEVPDSLGQLLIDNPIQMVDVKT